MTKLAFRSTGRTAEFESVALPHMGDLYRSAARLLGDATLAEDLIQEVYLRAWRSFHTYESGTNCRAWLYKIMLNCVRDQRRRWKTNPVVADEAAAETRSATAAAATGALTNRAISEAIDQLPLNYKEVLLLADVEEFSYREIASTLDLPIGTVMSRLSRARGLLREHLTEVAGLYGIGNRNQQEGPS